ncbi:hypothetical protein FQZ97_1105150 [compost metagenome]
MLVLVRTDEAAAHTAGIVQRTGNIAGGAVAVPRTDGAADRGLEFLGRLLANQVDGGGRVARTRHQAGRTLDDFDAVEAGRVIAVVRVLTVDTVVRLVDPVVLEVGDGKAAGGKLGTVTVVFLRRHAGGIAQRVADTLRAAIVHLLTGDHGDRLRRFAG